MKLSEYLKMRPLVLEMLDWPPSLETLELSNNFAYINTKEVAEHCLNGRRHTTGEEPLVVEGSVIG